MKKYVYILDCNMGECKIYNCDIPEQYLSNIEKYVQDELCYNLNNVSWMITDDIKFEIKTL